VRGEGVGFLGSLGRCKVAENGQTKELEWENNAKWEGICRCKGSELR